MAKISTSIPSWRPPPSADTEEDWNTQLGFLREHEAEISSLIETLGRGRGALLIGGTSDEVSRAEAALASAHAEAERIPIMRAEIISRRDAAAAREEVAEIFKKREQIAAEVEALVTDMSKIEALAKPLVQMMEREREVTIAVERFNSTFQAARGRHGLDGELLRKPVELYGVEAAHPLWPMFRRMRIPALCSDEQWHWMIPER